MRKVAPILVALFVGLTLALTLALPAAADTKKARKLLRETRALLTEVAQNVDAVTAAAGVDLQFIGSTKARAAGFDPSAPREDEQKVKPAKLRREVLALIDALHSHMRMVRDALKTNKRKKDADRAKNLLDALKGLRGMLKSVHDKSPGRDLWAIVEVEKKARKIRDTSWKWTDSSKPAPGGASSGGSTEGNRAQAIVENMQASIEEMRRVSERLRHKDRASATPPREELEQYADDLRNDANRLLEYWQGQKKKKKQVAAAKALLKRLQPVDRAIANIPKKPWKNPKALGKLEATLAFVIDGKEDDDAELTGSLVQ